MKLLSASLYSLTLNYFPMCSISYFSLPLCSFWFATLLHSQWNLEVSGLSYPVLLQTAEFSFSFAWWPYCSWVAELGNVFTKNNQVFSYCMRYPRWFPLGSSLPSWHRNSGMVTASLGLKCLSSKAKAGGFTVNHCLPVKSLLNIHVLHESFM